MRQMRLALIATLVAGLAATVGSNMVLAIECPPCGPLYCKNDPAFPAALKSKKDGLSKAGYPTRFFSLLDKSGQCLACVNNAPNAFTIMTVKPNGNKLSIIWDKDNERIAQEQLKSGELASYYVFNARPACACCQETRAEERPDYDANLELNRNSAIRCVKGAGNTVSCN
jgi:hypothetical protein